MFDRRLPARIASVPATARMAQIRTRANVPEPMASEADPHSDPGQRGVPSAALTTPSSVAASSSRIEATDWIHESAPPFTLTPTFDTPPEVLWPLSPMKDSPAPPLCNVRDRPSEPEPDVAPVVGVGVASGVGVGVGSGVGVGVG